jgi:hypothetical protein
VNGDIVLRGDGRAQADGELWMAVERERRAEAVHKSLSDSGRATRAADEENRVKIRGANARIVHGSLENVHCPLDKRLHHLFEFSAKDSHSRRRRVDHDGDVGARILG